MRERFKCIFSETRPAATGAQRKIGVATLRRPIGVRPEITISIYGMNPDNIEFVEGEHYLVDIGPQTKEDQS